MNGQAQAGTQAQAGGALAGLRVLDVSNFMAGPTAAMYLGDFGAEVIKVEHPRGDGFRHWGRTRDGEPLFWKMLSRNKRCITLDMGQPAGAELLRELVRVSDVLVENFTPGVMARWGLGYAQLAEINPRLIMLSISCFGQTGPYAQRPGFGTLAEAMSGYAHISGQPDGPPTLPSFGLADGLAGLNGAFGVLAALNHRHLHGVGQHVEASLLEPLLTLLGPQVIEYDQLGVVQNRLGSRLPFSAPRNVYPTRDGRYLSMSSSAQSVFERTMQAIGRPELVADERYATNSARVANREELVAILQELLLTKDADDWIAACDAANIPSGKINTIEQVFAHPQTLARDMLVEIEHPTAGLLKLAGIPFAMSETPAKVRLAPPTLGQHTDEVLRERLGYGQDAIDDLRRDGII